MDTVYLNGEYLPATEARVAVTDRGFSFGDGVYEVSPVYRGRVFRMDARLARLRRSLDGLRIAYEPSPFATVHEELLARNDLIDAPMAVVYFQVTRGAPALRTHHFPVERAAPTVFAYARPFPRLARDAWEDGAAAITVPDGRWSRADLKTLQLLPNVLAQEAAREAGVSDAIFVRDGIALEGAHNNLFLVFDETVRTHPASNQILPGITRAFILELAQEGGYAVEERATPVEDLRRATEVFLTGSTTEVRPIVRVDGRPVGDGKVGPASRALYDAYLERVDG